MPRRARPAASLRSSASARARRGRLEIELRDAGTQAGDLVPELLGALGRGRLERERAQALAHLLLEVARALDLDRDARELQLGPVAAPLEAAEAGGLLDSARRSAGFDESIFSTRPWPTIACIAPAEADVGEQLDDVGAAHRRAVDEVLALAAAMEPPGDATSA